MCEYQAGVCLNALLFEMLEATALSGQVRDMDSGGSGFLL